MPERDDRIFAGDYKEEPYWWEAFRPQAIEAPALPRRTDVVVVGGGYAGLSTARALADGGIESVVVDAGDFGSGASTRSGGAISAGLSIGKSFTGKTLAYEPAFVREVVGWSIAAYRSLQELVASEKIDCHLEQRGRFLGACASAHYDALRVRHDKLRAGGATDCHLVSREEQRAEIGSDYYHGGLVLETAGKLHPALFYSGLLAAVRRRNSITLAGQTRASKLERTGTGWRVATSAGELAAKHVVVATNGYTSALTPHLQRRLVPIASHVIATEELPEGLALKLCPKGRTFSETRRVLNYYRLSPDGRRVIFGGRARFTEIDGRQRARLLRRSLLQRFPELAGTRITHSWQGNVAFTYDALPHAGCFDGLHFVVGCNGSGVSMMPYLGDAMGRALAGRLHGKLPFENVPLPSIPLYSGKPWFLPAIGGAFRALDYFDERIR
ncbi:MAG: FAD-binding oxidoreductase [Enhydrobacter sp.]|nr:FAD-binding oxidoreductase [Enhydrobacter sp.]